MSLRTRVGLYGLLGWFGAAIGCSGAIDLHFFLVTGYGALLAIKALLSPTSESTKR